ncbi:hypothetical protein EIP91_011580, partial [Steccherinum ochraceum]
GKSDLDDYADKVTLDELKTHATRIVNDYADPFRVFELRDERRKEQQRMSDPENELDKLTTGDMVFENAVLFMRHALMFREFTDSIKDGDSGRIYTVIKWLALAYRGCNRFRYAHEALHLLHNLTHVWPDKFRDIIMNNWLVNPTGKPFAWVPADLVQEHMNFWIKRIYKAYGSNASWEWLAKVSPCIDILRKLATHLNHELGGRQGSKHHSPELWNDITVLKNSLQQHNVYTLQPGRAIPGTNAVVPNIVNVGLNALAGPLAEFNEALKTLQERMGVAPIYTSAPIPLSSMPTSAHVAQAVGTQANVSVPLSSAAGVVSAASSEANMDSEESGSESGAETSDTASTSGSKSADSGSDVDEAEWFLEHEDEILPLESEEDVDLDME